MDHRRSERLTPKLTEGYPQFGLTFPQKVRSDAQALPRPDLTVIFLIRQGS